MTTTSKHQAAQTPAPLAAPAPIKAKKRSTSTLAKAKAPAAKRGGQTRAQRTAKVRSNPGYGVAVLMPGGTPFSYRKSDGLIIYAEVEQAIFDATGKAKRFRDFLRTKRGQDSLTILLGGGDPGATFLAAEYLDRGDGRDGLAHPSLVAEFAGTASAAFRQMVFASEVARANGQAHRPRPLDAAGARLVQTRKDWSSSLNSMLGQVMTEYLATDPPGRINKKTGEDMGPPTFKQKISEARGHFIKALTGDYPSHWAAEMGGKDWADRASLGFQQTVAGALEQALALFPRAAERAHDPNVIGFWRHYHDALKEGALKARAAAEVVRLPWVPDNEGAAFSAGRIRRILAAAPEAGAAA
jgi:hypothetical protein